MEKLVYTKADFIKALAEALGKTQKDSKTIVDTMSDLIVDCLAETTPECEVEVKALDGVVFKGKYTEAREGRNPATGDIITIEPRVRVKTSFTNSFKKRVNGEME